MPQTGRAKVLSATAAREGGLVAPATLSRRVLPSPAWLRETQQHLLYPAVIPVTGREAAALRSPPYSCPGQWQPSASERPILVPVPPGRCRGPGLLDPGKGG